MPEAASNGNSDYVLDIVSKFRDAASRFFGEEYIGGFIDVSNCIKSSMESDSYTSNTDYEFHTLLGGQLLEMTVEELPELRREYYERLKATRIFFGVNYDVPLLVWPCDAVKEVVNPFKRRYRYSTPKYFDPAFNDSEFGFKSKTEDARLYAVTGSKMDIIARDNYYRWRFGLCSSQPAGLQGLVYQSDSSIPALERYIEFMDSGSITAFGGSYSGLRRRMYNPKTRRYVKEAAAALAPFIDVPEVRHVRNSKTLKEETMSPFHLNESTLDYLVRPYGELRAEDFLTPEKKFHELLNFLLFVYMRHDKAGGRNFKGLSEMELSEWVDPRLEFKPKQVRKCLSICMAEPFQRPFTPAYVVHLKNQMEYGPHRVFEILAVTAVLLEKVVACLLYKGCKTIRRFKVQLGSRSVLRYQATAWPYVKFLAFPSRLTSQELRFLAAFHPLNTPPQAVRKSYAFRKYYTMPEIDNLVSVIEIPTVYTQVGPAVKTFDYDTKTYLKNPDGTVQYVRKHTEVLVGLNRGYKSSHADILDDGADPLFNAQLFRYKAFLNWVYDHNFNKIAYPLGDDPAHPDPTAHYNEKKFDLELKENLARKVAAREAAKIAMRRRKTVVPQSEVEILEENKKTYGEINERFYMICQGGNSWHLYFDRHEISHFDEWLSMADAANKGQFNFPISMMEFIDYPEVIQGMLLTQFKSYLLSYSSPESMAITQQAIDAELSRIRQDNEREQRVLDNENYASTSHMST